MTFVTLEELSHYTGTDYRWDENAGLVLEAACQAVRDFLDQDIDYVADDEITFLVRPNREVLRLPQLPVVEITSVVIDDDDPLAADEYELHGRSGLALVDGTCWPNSSRVVVVYSHGWATTAADVDEAAGITRVPAPIRTKALELAAGGVNWAATGSGGAVESEQIGRYSYTASPDSEFLAMTLDEDSGMSIARYREVGVA